jgi:NAD(P)H-dependent flavin oxidoreductase YrpB (nitropropane dioxygenase family)
MTLKARSSAGLQRPHAQERHEELIRYAIDGAVEQVRRAYDIASGKGAININVLWEMGGAQRCSKACWNAPGPGLGVTCGAGMPYKLSEIAARFNVSYLPIVSSGRAFRALWKRAYHKVAHLMAAVVYEDPWLAGGHNGLSNAENPRQPEDPYPRVKALRDTMRAEGVSDDVPIVMAGGVWFLREWNNWIDNPELGAIAFQFGTRPLLTEESPIPQAWKDHLRTLEPGDVLLHSFSPTGFIPRRCAIRSCALRGPSARPYSKVEAGEHTVQLDVGVKGKNFWVTPADLARAREWFGAGFTTALRTPDDTVIFVNPQEREEIRKDQADCMAACRTAASRRGRTMTTTPPGAWPIRAASASRRRCKTSPMVAM